MAHTQTALEWLRDGKRITKQGWGPNEWIKLHRDECLEQIVDEKGFSYSLSKILELHFLADWSIWTEERDKGEEFLEVLNLCGNTALTTDRICDILKYLLTQTKKKG